MEEAMESHHNNSAGFPRRRFGSLFDQLIEIFGEYKPSYTRPRGWNIETQDASHMGINYIIV